MKIFIPFKIQDIGGTATFAAKFAHSLKRKGHSVTFEPNRKYDLLFIIADCPLKYVFWAKLKGKKIVQRLDGVYYPATPAGWRYPIFNLKMKIIHNWLADFVVYQSKFSQLSCQKFLGAKNNNFAIIYNGVDLEQFKPAKSADKKELRLVAAAKFRRPDQIEPIIEGLKNLSLPYHLDVYGTYTENLANIFGSFENDDKITFRGKVPNDELMKEIAGHDLFLFSDQSACPNSVLEALAAGLPVVAYDRGSIKELIESGYDGEVVALKNHDPFRDTNIFGPESYTAFGQKIEDAAGNIKYYKENARKSAEERFSLEAMTENYIRIFEAI